jgi:valyl-tRNA synthetase
MNVDRAEQAGIFSLKTLWAPQSSLPAATNDPRPATSPALSQFRSFALEDKWILSRFNRTAEQVNAALADFRFHEAANQVYHFFWDEFCDWYIELLKLRFVVDGPDSAVGERPTPNSQGLTDDRRRTTDDRRQQSALALANALTLFEASLRLLSPFMPFITEEIWQAIYDGNAPEKSIALARYPQADQTEIDLTAETEMAILQDLIVSVRNLRAERKIEPRERAPIRIFASPGMRRLFEQNSEAISRLANVEAINWSERSLAGAPGSRSTARFDVQLIYERKIDVAAERERLSKELQKYEAELQRAQGQLANEKFLSKAPPNVVEGLRTRAAELQALVVKSQAALKQLE